MNPTFSFRHPSRLKTLVQKRVLFVWRRVLLWSSFANFAIFFCFCCYCCWGFRSKKKWLRMQTIINHAMLMIKLNYFGTHPAVEQLVAPEAAVQKKTKTGGPEVWGSLMIIWAIFTALLPLPPTSYRSLSLLEDLLCLARFHAYGRSSRPSWKGDTVWNQILADFLVM